MLGRLPEPGFPRWALTSPPATSPSPPEHALDSDRLPVSSTTAISGSPASEFALRSIDEWR